MLEHLKPALQIAVEMTKSRADLIRIKGEIALISYFDYIAPVIKEHQENLGCGVVEAVQHLRVLSDAKSGGGRLIESGEGEMILLACGAEILIREMNEENNQEKFSKKMTTAAAFIESEFDEVGFLVLVFPHDAPGVSNYISNVNRENMIRAMREAADRLENNTDNKWKNS